MKTITIILFTVLLNACGSSKTAVNAEETSVKTSAMEVTKTAQESIKIVYRAHARGNFKKVVLDNKTISVQIGYDAKPVISTCSDEDWNTLIALIENANLKAISKLEPPSKAHQYDGAPLANFTVTIGETVYDLKPFDAGNPHDDAAEMVNKVINIAGLNKL